MRESEFHPNHWAYVKKSGLSDEMIGKMQAYSIRQASTSVERSRTILLPVLCICVESQS